MPDITVTEPGVFLDMPEEVYHADPCPETSLSRSGAVRLMESPRRFKWDREHPKTKPEFDFGSAAHQRLLGVGPEVVAVHRFAKDGTSAEAEDWRSPSTQEHREALRAEGKIGLLRKQVDVIDAMYAELMAHPLTPVLFGEGAPEASLFWRDPETAIMLRARLDWRGVLPSGRPVLVDYKTTARSAHPDEFRWEAMKYKYHWEDHWHREAADTLIGDDHAFLFLVQEKDAPYECAYHEVWPEAREEAALMAGVARARYLTCMTSDEWPGIEPVVHLLRVPLAR